MDLRPVSHANWQDFEALFESRGGPHYCWCTLWQKSKPAKHKSDKKLFMREAIERGAAVGILGYLEGEPVAWCSVAPRESFRPLGGVDSIAETWSVVCMFIKRSHRGRGLSRRLIKGAVEYAASQGARYVESYPVRPDSPSYRFMGLCSSFERAGFEYQHMAGKRRHVMLLKL